MRAVDPFFGLVTIAFLVFFAWVLEPEEFRKLIGFGDRDGSAKGRIDDEDF